MTPTLGFQISGPTLNFEAHRTGRCVLASARDWWGDLLLKKAAEYTPRFGIDYWLLCWINYVYRGISQFCVIVFHIPLVGSLLLQFVVLSTGLRKRHQCARWSNETMKLFWRSSHVEVTSPRWHSLSAWHFQARWISPMPLTHASFLLNPGRIQFVRRKGVCGVRSFGPGLGVWQSSLTISWASGMDTHDAHNWVTGCLVQMHQKLQLSAPLRLNFKSASTDIPSDQPQENPMKHPPTGSTSCSVHHATCRLKGHGGNGRHPKRIKKREKHNSNWREETPQVEYVDFWLCMLTLNTEQYENCARRNIQHRWYKSAHLLFVLLFVHVICSRPSSLQAHCRSTIFGSWDQTNCQGNLAAMAKATWLSTALLIAAVSGQSFMQRREAGN